MTVNRLKFISSALHFPTIYQDRKSPRNPTDSPRKDITSLALYIFGAIATATATYYAWQHFKVPIPPPPQIDPIPPPHVNDDMCPLNEGEDICPLMEFCSILDRPSSLFPSSTSQIIVNDPQNQINSSYKENSSFPKPGKYTPQQLSIESVALLVLATFGVTSLGLLGCSIIRRHLNRNEIHVKPLPSARLKPPPSTPTKASQATKPASPKTPDNTTQSKTSHSSTPRIVALYRQSEEVLGKMRNVSSSPAKDRTIGAQRSLIKSDFKLTVKQYMVDESLIDMQLETLNMITLMEDSGNSSIVSFFTTLSTKLTNQLNMIEVIVNISQKRKEVLDTEAKLTKLESQITNFQSHKESESLQSKLSQVKALITSKKEQVADDDNVDSSDDDDVFNSSLPTFPLLTPTPIRELRTGVDVLLQIIDAGHEGNK